jgi:hypothetical protein
LKPDSERWGEPLQLDNGIMGFNDAKRFGVRCIVSEKLRKMSSENTVARHAPLGELGITDNTKIPAIKFQENATGQLLQIQQDAYPNIRWYQQIDGTYFIYDVSETNYDIALDANFSKEMRNVKPLILPAVYDITVGGTRTIRCPFISFISSMQVLGFSAKYNISSLVGYFYHPQQQMAWYLALLIDIEFSTTGDENQMTIMCVDTDAPKPPVADSTAGSAAEARLDRWKEAEVVVKEWKDYGEGQPDGSWSQIALTATFMNMGNDTVNAVDVTFDEFHPCTLDHRVKVTRTYGLKDMGDEGLANTDAPVNEIYSETAPITKDIRGAVSISIGTGPDGPTDAPVTINLDEKSELVVTSKAGTAIEFGKAVSLTCKDELAVTADKALSFVSKEEVTLKSDGSGLLGIGNAVVTLGAMVGELLDDISAMKTVGSPAQHTVSPDDIAKFTALKSKWDSVFK